MFKKIYIEITNICNLKCSFCPPHNRENKYMSFDEFRGSISKYAVAKDGEGNYIYDETIAEAFHDCYLNGDDAQLASKLIVSVLLSYL